MTNDSPIELKCACGETYFAGQQHIGKFINCPCGREIFVARPLPPETYNSAYYGKTDSNAGKSGAGKLFTADNIGVMVLGMVCLFFGAKFFIGYFQSANENSNAKSSHISSPSPSPTMPDYVYNRNYNQKIELPANFSFPPQKSVSLKNGTAITPPQGPRGKKFLKIVNDFDFDVAVKLVENTTGKTRRFFYVKANSNATVRGIANEDCRLFFSTGEDWSAEDRKFLRNAAYNEFEKVLSFRKTIGWKVGLKPRIDGTVLVSSIDEEQFADK